VLVDERGEAGSKGVGGVGRRHGRARRGYRVTAFADFEWNRLSFSVRSSL
jgi:hypothetical protein